NLPCRNRMMVLNKCDQSARLKLAGRPPAFSVSALTGKGLSALKRAVLGVLMPQQRVEGALITSLRQRDCLAKCLDAVRNCETALQEGAGEEILALELRGALASLASITGEVTDDDILNHIFSRFCIGK
ncbi:MAG: tRNA uridine-5-carboxymethylaminomethyl(34) synthesis GTPase MnmE, partial [Fibrobacterota bacterium]